MTGEVAVCLTFKNISQEVLSDLVINFKCKNAAGEVVCEAPYHYENLNVNQGELFGQDDAVYVAKRLGGQRGCGTEERRICKRRIPFAGAVQAGAPARAQALPPGWPAA